MTVDDHMRKVELRGKKVSRWWKIEMNAYLKHQCKCGESEQFRKNTPAEQPEIVTVIRTYVATQKLA